MADMKKFVDVWIVESNTVYREVPYTVVADWVQQGRLLEDDMLRPSGTSDWFPLGDSPAFKAYLPKATRYRVDDQAEALLIFFMMTATVASSSSLINVPTAGHGVQILGDPQLLWIGIEKAKNGTLYYSLGKAEQGPAKEDQKLTEDELLQHLDQRLGAEGPVDVIVKADRTIAYEVIQRMSVSLDKHRGRIRKTHTGVNEKEHP
jgi:biopolymer transport protein ExbD